MLLKASLCSCSPRIQQGSCHCLERIEGDFWVYHFLLYILPSLVREALGKIARQAAACGEPAALWCSAGFTFLHGMQLFLLLRGQDREMVACSCLCWSSKTHRFPQFGKGCYLWVLSGFWVFWGWGERQLAASCIRINHWYYLLVKVECISSRVLLQSTCQEWQEHAFKTPSWMISCFFFFLT